MSAPQSTGETPNTEDSLESTAAYVKAALIARGYKFGHSEIKGIESLLFTGEKLEISVSVFCGDSYITFVASLPLVVEDALSGEVLKSINEHSTKLPIGGYELHTSSKKVLFKVGMPVPPKLTPEVLEEMLLLAVSSADSFSGVLLTMVQISTTKH